MNVANEGNVGGWCRNSRHRYCARARPKLMFHNRYLPWLLHLEVVMYSGICQRYNTCRCILDRGRVKVSQQGKGEVNMSGWGQCQGAMIGRGQSWHAAAREPKWGQRWGWVQGTASEQVWSWGATTSRPTTEVHWRVWPLKIFTCPVKGDGHAGRFRWVWVGRIGMTCVVWVALQAGDIVNNKNVKEKKNKLYEYCG